MPLVDKLLGALLELEPADRRFAAERLLLMLVGGGRVEPWQDGDG
jgi:hypothetical protein